MPAIAGLFHAPELLHAFATLADTIRGRRRSPLSPRFWKTFAVSTLPLRQLVAKEIARSLAKRAVGMDRILDVGAGASPLGVELLRRHPRASLTALDRAGVVAIAARHAREAGVGSRVSTRSGNIVTAEWGGPFDLVLLVNLLDYFDARRRRRLLRKAHAALPPGGHVIVSAPMLSPSRTSPADGVAYDLFLLALGARGRAQTMKELRGLLRASGFSVLARGARATVVMGRRS